MAFAEFGGVALAIRDRLVNHLQGNIPVLGELLRSPRLFLIHELAV